MVCLAMESAELPEDIEEVADEQHQAGTHPAQAPENACMCATLCTLRFIN
jgi:hypothetical protein